MWGVQVDIELNLVKNILSSYKAQSGMAGPASNIYGVCVCVCNECIFTHVSIQLSARTHESTQARSTHTHMRTHACMHARTAQCKHIHTNTRMHMQAS